MIKQSSLAELLGVALSTGGDFSEVYAEHTRSNTIQFVDGKIDKVNDSVLSGVGIRIFKGERTVYAGKGSLPARVRRQMPWEKERLRFRFV